jgi:DNA modification methylase
VGKVKNFINNVTFGDCIEVMSLFPDDCIDLTVTSPPYDDLRNYNGYTFSFENVAKELYRITKPGGVVVWVVGDKTHNGSETGTSFKQALFFKEIGFNLHDTMIYQKDSISFPDTNRYYQIFEYMFIFSKGKPKTTNLLRDRENKWADGKKRIKGRERQPDGSLKGRRKGNLLQPYGVRFNIWRYAVGKNKSTKDEIAYNHPAIFPEKLAEDHILSWSNPGDVVLDPMCGSGTTLKMAKLSNRDFIGIDCSREYVELASERLKLNGIENEKENLIWI